MMRGLADVDPEMRFAVASLRESARIAGLLEGALLFHAAERAARDGRGVVEASDVADAIRDAVGDFAREPDA
jgi:hypothetical protein